MVAKQEQVCPLLVLLLIGHIKAQKRYFLVIFWVQILVTFSPILVLRDFFVNLSNHSLLQKKQLVKFGEKHHFQALFGAFLSPDINRADTVWQKRAKKAANLLSKKQWFLTTFLLLFKNCSIFLLLLIYFSLLVFYVIISL